MNNQFMEQQWADACGQMFSFWKHMQNYSDELYRPSVMYRPKIYMDGNKWCALYGEDLVEGVAGFGGSPDSAMRDFDKNFRTKIEDNQ